MRATAALEAAGVPYAVTGGNAAAAWVAQVNEAAVRNTQYVDILISRVDFDRVTSALEAIPPADALDGHRAVGLFPTPPAPFATGPAAA